MRAASAELDAFQHDPAVLIPEMTTCGREGDTHHGRHVASATPPVRAPAFDGPAKVTPYVGWLFAPPSYLQ